MYKGNMYEFVEKVSEYMQKTFGRTVKLEQHASFDHEIGKRNKDKKDWIVFVSTSPTSATGYKVYDAQDFEDQVYEVINKVLEQKREKGEITEWSFPSKR